jgi:hypothetical protein
VSAASPVDIFLLLDVQNVSLTKLSFFDYVGPLVAGQAMKVWGTKRGFQLICGSTAAIALLMAPLAAWKVGLQRGEREVTAVHVHPPSALQATVVGPRRSMIEAIGDNSRV